MTVSLQPFGLRPVGHMTSGVVRQHAGSIASGYAANIFLNTPVVLNASGLLEVAVAGGTNNLVGSFAGCEYTAADGRRVVSKYWPSGTVATEIVAYYYRDPEILYEVQSTGSIAAVDLGSLVSLSNPGNGSVATGFSTATCGLTGGTQLQVVGFNAEQDNVAGDAFTKIQVLIARHQFAAVITGF